METFFKIVFFTSVVIFALISVAFFLLIIKIALLFIPEVRFFGIRFS